MTLNQILAQAQAIRPDVKYVSQETRCGEFALLNKDEYWAMTGLTAFVGSTPDELLSNILASTKESQAA